MKKQYGARIMTKPKGMSRPIFFPALGFMDLKTGDGRLLESAGGGTRDLPQTIWGQFQQSSGHDGAVIIGSLHEVTMNDDGVVSASGWLLDDANGQQAITYLETQSMRGNSIDLADTTVELEFSDDYEDMTIKFTAWNVAGTTLVGRPAFSGAYASLDEELVASWFSSEEPLVVEMPMIINILSTPAVELVADGSKRPSWDLFHQVEPSVPHKILVGEENADGFIPACGHLALWNTCHDAYAECMIVPRPNDNYAGFNGPGVLTDKGIVSTGPIFAIGGHPKPGELRNKSVAEAYGGIENAWADGRVVAGVHGPWFSGYVRPGTPEETVVAARASKVSGHWLGGSLKAVVSVNCPGYEVPSEGFSLAADGSVLELVASFSCPEEEVEVDELESLADELSPWDLASLRFEMAAQDLASE